jgi:hypothetical protein
MVRLPPPRAWSHLWTTFRRVTPNEVLLEAYERLPGLVEAAVGGLSVEQLSTRLDPEANTIGWLVWHLTRVQDDHVAGAFGTEQVWTSQGWPERFALPFDVAEHGYGHSSEQVAAVQVEAGLLVGYFDAVHAQTRSLLATVSGDELDRIVDDSYDPPVTLGVRLVSVLEDDLQHVGQAAFIRGVLERSRR